MAALVVAALAGGADGWVGGWRRRGRRRRRRRIPTERQPPPLPGLQRSGVVPIGSCCVGKTASAGSCASRAGAPSPPAGWIRVGGPPECHAPRSTLKSLQPHPFRTPSLQPSRWTLLSRSQAPNTPPTSEACTLTPSPHHTTHVAHTLGTHLAMTRHVAALVLCLLAMAAGASANSCTAGEPPASCPPALLHVCACSRRRHFHRRCCCCPLASPPPHPPTLLLLCSACRLPPAGPG